MFRVQLGLLFCTGVNRGRLCQEDSIRMRFFGSVVLKRVCGIKRTWCWSRYLEL